MSAESCTTASPVPAPAWTRPVYVVVWRLEGFIDMFRSMGR
jgi:hypothetical protein